MSDLIKNIIFALVFAVVAYIGYAIFIKDSDPALTASNAEISNQAIRDAQDFLQKLQQLQTIELRGELFSDPRFTELVDLRQDIVDEPAGRPNPFVPVQ